MQNIGQFDKTALKHAETDEKNTLPSKEGEFYHQNKYVCPPPPSLKTSLPDSETFCVLACEQSLIFMLGYNNFVSSANILERVGTFL